MGEGQAPGDRPRRKGKTWKRKLILQSLRKLKATAFPWVTLPPGGGTRTGTRRPAGVRAQVLPSALGHPVPAQECHPGRATPPGRTCTRVGRQITPETCTSISEQDVYVRTCVRTPVCTRVCMQCVWVMDRRGTQPRRGRLSLAFCPNPCEAAAPPPGGPPPESPRRRALSPRGSSELPTVSACTHMHAHTPLQPSLGVPTTAWRVN